MSAFLALALLAAPPPIRYSGAVSTELVAYPQSPDGLPPATAGIDFEARVTVPLGRSLRLHVAPRLRAFPGDPGRSRVIPQEAWTQLRLGRLDLTVGLQRFSWGVGVLSRPTDTLNQRDYGAGFFHPQKLGELALSARLRTEHWRVDFIYIPLFQHPGYPTGDNILGVSFGRLGPLGLATRTGWLTDRVGLETMTFGARIRASLPQLDLELVWISGPARLPGPFIDDLTLRDVVYAQDMVGGSAQWALGPVILRGEIAWRSSARAATLVAAANPYPWTEPIPPSYGAWVLGAEWTAWDFVGDADLSLVVEGLGEFRPYRDAQAALRPFDHDLFVSATLRLDDLDDTQLSLAAAIDWIRGDTVLTASASRRLVADLSLSLDAVWLIAGADGPLGLVAALADRDQLRARLRWDF